MNKKYKPVIAVAVLVILVAILGIVTHVVMKYIPSSEKMDLNEYYGEMADGQIALVIGTEKLEERGLVDGDRVYLPLDVVNTYLNQRYYWDSANQQILYATPSELTSASASSEAGDKVWVKDDKVYLKIIDYKSGRTKFDLASVFHGLQLQLMVYMNAAREEQQQKKKQCIVIPAGILYYHIDDPFVTSDNFRDFAGNQPVGSDEQNEDYSDSSGAAEDVLSILEQLAVLCWMMAMLFDIWIITRRNHRKFFRSR